MNESDREKYLGSKGKRYKSIMKELERAGCGHELSVEDSVPMIVHVRPDLYRAFMRCVWMLVYEEGMSPLDAQNRLVEEFLRYHGC